MSIPDKYFTDEHFAHPEGWTWASHRIEWITRIPETDKLVISFRHKVTNAHMQDIISVHHGSLSYTPPDPWEGVALPFVWVGGGRFDFGACTGHFYMNLPTRRFRLVPVED